MAIRNRSILVCAMVASAAGFAATAQIAGPQAQPAPAAAPEPGNAELIAQLKDPNLPVRESAQRKLADRISQGELESALRGDALSPEQRLRLEQIGGEVLQRTPRAALGVSFATFPRDALVVSAVLENFESRKTLRAGDEITAVGGRPVSGVETDLRPAVIMHSPGEEIPVRILREGMPMTVRVKLGDFRDLSRSPMWDGLRRDDYLRAWQMRLADLRQERARSEPALDSGLTEEGWREATRGEAGDTTFSWGDPTLVAAGQPRNAGADRRTGRTTLRTRGVGDAFGADDLRRLRDLHAKRLELQMKLLQGGLDAAARLRVQAQLDDLELQIAKVMWPGGAP